MEEGELPTGWAEVPLGELSEIIRGITFPASAKESAKSVSNVCCLRTSNVQAELIWNDIFYVDRTFVKRPDQLVRVGDILMSMANSYELVGKVSVAREVPQEAAFGAFLAAIRPLAVSDGRYLFYFLRSESVQRQIRSGSSQTTNIANISAGKLREIIAPLAPLNEQRRIAAKLDTTLAAVETCRHRLDGVAAILKRFRQAVLAAATSGELTREWRDERGLADSWKTKVLSEIADSRLGKMLDQGKNTGQLTPYLRNVNVRWFSFDLEDIQEIRLADKEIIDLDVRFGDLLVCEGGEPGRCAVWRGEDSKYTFQKALHRVRTSKCLLADYLSFCLSNSANNGKLEQLFTGTTIKHLTGASLKKFQILLPSREEQEEIVDRVETFFTLADQLEARLTAARKVVDRLTPALLAKAFRGELVHQDPTDEPASVLLERIRAARQAEAGAGKPSRRGRPKAAANPAPMNRNAAPAPSEPLPPDLLTDLLQECGALSERALLAASELEPGRFTEQLQLELQAGKIREELEEGERVLVVGG